MIIELDNYNGLDLQKLALEVDEDYFERIGEGEEEVCDVGIIEEGVIVE